MFQPECPLGNQEVNSSGPLVLLIWRSRGGLEGWAGHWWQTSQVSVTCGWGAIHPEKEWMGRSFSSAVTSYGARVQCLPFGIRRVCAHGCCMYSHVL